MESTSNIPTPQVDERPSKVNALKESAFNDSCNQLTPQSSPRIGAAGAGLRFRSSTSLKDLLRAKLARAQALCKEAASECEECVHLACDATGVPSNHAVKYALEAGFASLVTAASAFFAIVQALTGVAPGEPSPSQNAEAEVPPAQVDSEVSEEVCVLADDLPVVFSYEDPAPLAVPESEWRWEVYSDGFDWSASGCFLLDLAAVDWSGWEPKVYCQPDPLAIPECDWVWEVYSDGFDWSASGCFLLDLAAVDWSGWEPKVYRPPVLPMMTEAIDEHGIVWETDVALDLSEPGLPAPDMAAIDWGAPGLPYYELGFVDWGAPGVPM